ncbi:hypothetical protein [Pseudomonas sp. Irchel s3b2]|uniref:hypothetical protein n=1 Tax=Pseudomonas sp. Irchel s3b2 TaxID=2009073 RepID=UPI0011404168|nr:hypothetical protein [Pseudomonas sp. Irchel s3b2]
MTNSNDKSGELLGLYQDSNTYPDSSPTTPFSMATFSKREKIVPDQKINAWNRDGTTGVFSYSNGRFS